MWLAKSNYHNMFKRWLINESLSKKFTSQIVFQFKRNQLNLEILSCVYNLIIIDFFNQIFSPQMQFTWQKYPCVLKAGHCHGGAATARLENQSALQDAAGLLVGSTASETQCYCVLEPYIDSKFDIHLQKIGFNYKAFMYRFTLYICWNFYNI